MAKDFRTKADKHREDLYAGTPPLEAIRMAFSKAVTRCSNKEGMAKARKIMFIDAKKAHLNSPCHEDVYIELPGEAGVEEGLCGKLSHWLYGCKRAAQAWEEFYSNKLESEGFNRGVACGVVFHHPGRDITCACHGDDFVLVGEDKELRWIAAKMKGWFTLKVRAVLGPEESDDKEVVILGRKVRWKPGGIRFEADPKHRKMLMEAFGLNEGSSGGACNGGREVNEEVGDDEEMSSAEATEFRGLVARLNFLAQDSPDLQYPAKEVSKDMAKPMWGSWKKLKKVVRYLVAGRTVEWRYGWQE